MIVMNIDNMKFNCDATNFTTGIAWIAQHVIVLFFRFKNLNILCVNDLKTKWQIIISFFLFHSIVVIDSSKVCFG